MYLKIAAPKTQNICPGEMKPRSGAATNDRVSLSDASSYFFFLFPFQAAAARQF